MQDHDLAEADTDLEEDKLTEELSNAWSDAGLSDDEPAIKLNLEDFE
jgi:hypothetical protein